MSTAARPLPEALRADGVCLRAPGPADIDAMVVACRDPEIPRWTRVPANYSHDDAVAFLGTVADDRASGVAFHYLVTDETDGTLLGACGIHHCRPDDATTEVGYWVAAPARGRGVARRALATVTGAALAAGYQRITADVMVGNEASRAVLSAVGYTEEGVLRSVKAGACGTGADRIDVHLYSLIATDPAAHALRTS